MTGYGIPTLMDLPNVNDLADFCVDNGFSFIEMNQTFPWFQSDHLDIEALRTIAKNKHIGFTIHLHDQVNPFEFSTEMRKGSLENVMSALKIAECLCISRITMHLLPGTYSSINGSKVYLYQHCMDRYLQYVMEFRTLIDDRLKNTDTIFCIENTSGFQDFHQKAIEMLLGSDVFGLTFDIGHSFRSGGGDEIFILKHMDKVRHFHVHDCSVKANHLGLGDGQLDVSRYLKMAKNMSASVVMEVKEAGALLRSKQYVMAQNLR